MGIQNSHVSGRCLLLAYCFILMGGNNCKTDRKERLDDMKSYANIVK